MSKSPQNPQPDEEPLSDEALESVAGGGPQLTVVPIPGPAKPPIFRTTVVDDPLYPISLPGTIDDA